MSEVQSYKCKNCQAPLRFDPKSQKLVCDHCGSEYEITDYDDEVREKKQDAEITIVPKEFSDDDLSKLKTYSCKSCGAELVTDENTIATSCPYCGNNAIIETNTEGIYQPDLIIPFSQTKDEIIPTLQSFYKNKPFLPKTFKDESRIKEIKGIYVPFWLYDGNASIETTYLATRTMSYRRGDELVTVTNHYVLYRDGDIQFQSVPADAAKRMRDDFMDAIEPYKLDEVVPFDTQYLAGFYADKYDVDQKEDKERIRKRIQRASLQEMQSTTLGYASAVPTNENVYLDVQNIHYAFLPVWIYVTKWKDKTYLFMMNGQTGKIVADDLPLDYTKMALTGLIIFGLLFIVLFMILKVAL